MVMKREFKVGDKVVVLHSNRSFCLKYGEIVGIDDNSDWPYQVLVPDYDGSEPVLFSAAELEHEDVYKVLSHEPQRLMISDDTYSFEPEALSTSFDAPLVETRLTESTGEVIEDEVNHPQHYIKNGFEVIEIIEAFELNFRLANVAKYVLRADSKHDDGGIQDLEKAAFYLDREIMKRKAARANS